MSWQDKHKVIPAAYVILRQDEKVLLLRRANTGYFDGKYAFPAGHIDGNESALMAAVREAKEEVDVVIEPKDMEFVHVTHRMSEEGDHERVDFFFTARKWQGEPHNMEPAKCDDVQWFPLNDLPKGLTPLTTQVLEQLARGSYYSDSNFK